MSGDKEKLDKFDIEKHIMMHRVAEMELRTGVGVGFSKAPQLQPCPASSINTAAWWYSATHGCLATVGMLCSKMTYADGLLA
jgi:hypothetical protein